MSASDSNSFGARPVRVWDLPSRLCHLGLIVSVLGAYGTAEWHWLDMQWHFYFGYAALVLVLFRVLWGFWGGEHARFRHFLRSPAAVLRYAHGLFSGASKESLGHSPVGGWAVVALLTALFAQAFSGLFNSDDIEWFAPLNEKASAELVDWMADFHESFYNVVLILIGIHIVAALLYLLLKKQNLIWPMVTGNKTSLRAPDAKQQPLWLAVLTLSIAGIAIWSVVRFWPSAA